MDILERLDRIEMGDQVLSDAAAEIRRLRALPPPEPTEAETLRRQLQYAADFWRGQLAAEMWHPTREHIEMVISAFDRAALRAMPLQDHSKAQPPKMRAETTPEMLELARRLVLERPSTSYIQRKLMIGYNHACEIMEHFEAQGLVSACRADGTRVILAEQETKS